MQQYSYNTKDEPVEATVYVRIGSPWIATYCSMCGNTVHNTQAYCHHCGQALSFKRYHHAMEHQSETKLTSSWKEYNIGVDEVNKDNFVERLIDLEESFGIEETSLLKVMRNAYVKTIFEK
jgi:hypothetical protein